MDGAHLTAGHEPRTMGRVHIGYGGERWPVGDEPRLGEYTQFEPGSKDDPEELGVYTQCRRTIHHECDIIALFTANPAKFAAFQPLSKFKVCHFVL